MSESQKTDIVGQVADRDRIIIRTSIVGIIANIFLAGFKAGVGLLAGSIAVILDAVNNLSDALSSVITIAGTKLAGKRPDKKHPLGYGRIEYISAVIVAAIVLYAGITSFVESVKSIFGGEKPDYSYITLIVIGSAVAVKFILGRYVTAQGKKVNSGSLIASGSDAMFDGILSASVLLSAVIFMITGVSLEAYVGIIISAVIVKSGIEMLMETLHEILGQRADGELTKSIKKLLCELPGVRGAYDLIIYNYGPERNYATVHLELPDTMTVDEADALTRKAQTLVFAKTGVILTGVGIYSYNTGDNEAAKMRSEILKLVTNHEWALQMHGFYADTENGVIRFDVVMSFDIDHNEGISQLTSEIKEKYPDYQVVIAPDVDVSDI